MAFTLSNRRGPRADINLTPLIDVLLVLLIIFMVTSPTRSVGLDAQVPQPPPDTVCQPNLVTLEFRQVAIAIDTIKGAGIERIGLLRN